MNIERLDFELRLILLPHPVTSAFCYCVSCSGVKLDTHNTPADVWMDTHHLSKTDYTCLKTLTLLGFSHCARNHKNGPAV